MKQEVFYNFDELIDFLRYVRERVQFTYVGQNDPNNSGLRVIVLEISEQDYNEAKKEYEADTYTNYEYV